MKHFEALKAPLQHFKTLLKNNRQHFKTLQRTSKQFTFDGVNSSIDLPFTIPEETENRIYSIQFSMPLFTSGLNNSERRQALLQEVKSEEQLILIERGIVQQIRTLHTALRTAELNIASLKSAVQSSKDALEATRL